MILPLVVQSWFFTLLAKHLPVVQELGKIIFRQRVSFSQKTSGLILKPCGAIFLRIDQM